MVENAASPASNVPPFVAMLQLFSTKVLVHAVCAAAKLGVPDALDNEPKSSAELAALVKCDASTLYRLLRGLTCAGVFEEVSQDRFAHTPLSRCLRRDAPVSVGAIAEAIGSDWHNAIWPHITSAVQDGRSAFEHAHGEPLFDYLAKRPSLGALFAQSMTGLSEMVNAGIAAIYDFAQAKLIVDVGGGQGSLLRRILERHSAARGIVFDQPGVVAGAPQTLDSALLSRLEFQGGNFFQDVPAGGDHYILKYILHDWSDEQASVILRNCRKAMPETARLLVVENVVPLGSAPSFAKILDVDMLALTGGRERTEAEFGKLFRSAGLSMHGVFPLPGSELCILEARVG